MVKVSHSAPINKPSRHLCAALAYAASFGWYVFPCYEIGESGRCTCGRPNCQSPGKHPRTEHGLKAATIDPEKIRRWWGRWPDANIAAATGAVSGFDALDIDPRHGGDESLLEMVAQNGPLPDTVEQLTGGGGRHLLFKQHPGLASRTGIFPGIDVRANGGYILVPPSNHSSGREYAWELSSRPGEVPLVEWPEGLLEALQPINGRSQSPAPAVEGVIPEGSGMRH